MDCFYAAVEMRDDPRLRHRPIAVGGSEHKRGVISTCNYEARAYGVHSAMATSHAKRLCPHLLVVPHHFEKYREASQAIRTIFKQYTKTIEPLSLDEAYLDVTDSQHCRGSATLMAKAIRQTIAEELQLTASAGIAANKFLAKVASDWNKPNGQCVILPTEVDAFMRPLPVKKLHGVGKVTTQKLHDLNFFTCGDLQKAEKTLLVSRFGSFGERLYTLCRGIDERPVQSEWQRQSLSVEHTYVNDLADLQDCLLQVAALTDEVTQRFEKYRKQYAVKKLFVKMKFNDFTQTTVECRADFINANAFAALFKQAYERFQRPVRLLGAGIRMTPKLTTFHQLNLDI